MQFHSASSRPHFCQCPTDMFDLLNLSSRGSSAEVSSAIGADGVLGGVSPTGEGLGRPGLYPVTVHLSEGSFI